MIHNLLAAGVLAIGALLGASASASAAGQELEGEALFAALKQGGYIIYLRHSISDLSQKDRDPITVGDCATQRNLTEEGRALARAIGEAFKTRQISVGSVSSSPFCRTEDTAKLAFGSVQPVSTLYYSFSLSKEAASTEAANLKQTLSQPPPAGKNAVIVGHVSNIRDVAGVWPKTEGGGLVFRPNGSGFEYVGTFSAKELINAAH